MNTPANSALESLTAAAVENERAVIGSALLDSATISELRALGVEPSSFVDKLRREMWVSIVEADDEGDRIGIDAVTIKSRTIARARCLVDDVTAEIVLCIETVPSVAHAQDYGRSLVALMDRRALLTIARTIERRSFDVTINDPIGESAEALARLEEARSMRVSASSRLNWPTALRNILEGSVNPARSTKILTGTHLIDEIAQGIERGALVTIAARPSVGKTTFGVHLVETLARHGQTAGIISLEMKGEDLATMILSKRANVPYSKIVSGQCSTYEFKALEDVAHRLETDRIHIDAPNGLNLSSFRASARRLVRHHGARVVVVDYLQLLQDRSAGENEYEQLSTISRGLKQLARELDVPIVALAQLNRSNEKDVRAPKLVDLRGSGSIEQDSDAVFALWRPKETADTNPGLVEAIVLKNRNGPIGSFRYRFDHVYRRIEEPARSSWAHTARLDSLRGRTATKPKGDQEESAEA